MIGILISIFFVALTGMCSSTTAGDLSYPKRSSNSCAQLLDRRMTTSCAGFFDIRMPVETAVQHQPCNLYNVRNMTKFFSKSVAIGLGCAGCLIGAVEFDNLERVQAAYLYGYAGLALNVVGSLATLALDCKLDHDEQKYAHWHDADDAACYAV